MPKETDPLREFKKGDKVYATKNPHWGRLPMVVIRGGSQVIVAKHPNEGKGGFHFGELALASPSRELQLKKLLSLEVQVEVLKEELFGPQ